MAFADGSHIVHLYLSYYAYQRPGAELMSAQSMGQEVPGWNDIGEQVRRVRSPDAQFEVNEKTIANGAKRRIMWSWYWVDGVFTSNSSTAKLLRAKSRLLRQPQDAAQITLVSDVDAADPSEVLRDFLARAEIAKLLSSFSDQPRQFTK
jgi:EpsI family protein